jgi:maltooligosyltrehalose trehalohydrolase
LVFAQNHDQVGNRMLGERLSRLVSFEGLKLAAGIVLLSPFIPLIFMGEEYGETAPFQYFTSHSDAGLIEAIRRGRGEEFADFLWQGEPPDPQDETTFLSTKLNHDLRHEGQHRILWSFYKELIQVRKDVPALSNLNKDTLKVLGYEKTKLIFVRRWSKGSQAIAVFNFGDAPSSAILPIPEGHWQKRLDSADKHWLGKGSHLPKKSDFKGEVIITMEQKSFALFTNSEEA